MTPTLPLDEGRALRRAAAPATSPTSRASGTPPPARAVAAASSGSAPGASRQYRLGHRAVYRMTANLRTISLVAAS